MNNRQQRRAAASVARKQERAAEKRMTRRVEKIRARLLNAPLPTSSPAEYAFPEEPAGDGAATAAAGEPGPRSADQPALGG